MPPRPYVLLSCATSADGYLDDASPRRLILSGPADLDRVDEVRAGCDAILVGAQTVRKDNPRLLIRDPRRSARRAARGLPEHPARVTLTATGDLDPRARFFAPGALRLVYCATPAIGRARARLGDTAVLIDAGDPLSLDLVLTDLAERGVLRVLVEGGARVLGDFLARDLADELDLAVAPFFVADPAAPRLNLPRLAPDARPCSDTVPPGLDPTTTASPNSPNSPMTLAEVRRVDEIVLLRYLLGPGGPDHRFLRWAVELSRLCPPSGSAFSVGAVIVGEDGEVLATGFSREQEDHDHAEEVALRKLALQAGPSRPAAAARHHLQLAGALRRPRVAPGDLRPAHRRGGHPAGRLRLARAPPVHRRRGRRTAPGRGRGRHRGARTGRPGPGGQRPPGRIRRVTSPPSCATAPSTAPGQAPSEQGVLR